ncbi:MAG: gluconokinase [Chloroflexi bacterium]|nr:gluconokinase [Chloroflexota bacterium]
MTTLVLDIGSSSVRALLIDEAAQPVPDALASRPHSFKRAPAGASTYDPETLLSEIEDCVDEVLAHPRAADIVAVGIDTFVGNLIGVDRRGHPATLLYTYADTRSHEDVAALAERIDESAMHQQTGCPHHTAYHPGRLRWLRRTQPEQFANVWQWVDLGALLMLRWFGDAVMSYSTAAWSGLLNRETLDWDADWLHILELDKAVLPPLADYKDARSGLRKPYAQRWPQLQNVPFFLAVGDGAAANIGSGCADPSRVALTVGTTAALRMVTGEPLPTIPDGLWSYRVDARRHLIGGATSEGGNIFSWARETLLMDGIGDLEAELARRGPDTHGLTFLPLLGGERSPGWKTDATGAIVGLRLSTTPMDILYAALEGVALRLSLISEQLEATAHTHPIVVASGGALRASPAWAQMITNAINCPLYIARQHEITARGTAILAMAAQSQCQLTDYPPPLGHRLDPQPERVEQMRAARERQMRLYNLL